VSRTRAVAKHGKRVALEVLGWALVLAGIAALVLPGPGLLGIFAGLVILSQQYEWAERRVEPVKEKALKGASDSVQTWPRIVFANLCALGIVGFGVFWLMQPAAPSWWPVDDKWWLFGGWPPGITLVASGLFAIGMIVYSFRRFRDEPYEEES
jgi:Putative transmembrane protein (PGPGW)